MLKKVIDTVVRHPVWRREVNRKIRQSTDCYFIILDGVPEIVKPFSCKKDKNNIGYVEWVVIHETDEEMIGMQGRILTANRNFYYDPKITKMFQEKI